MDLEADFLVIWRRTARGPQGHRHGSGSGDNQGRYPPCPPTLLTEHGGGSPLGVAGVAQRLLDLESCVRGVAKPAAGILLQTAAQQRSHDRWGAGGEAAPPR